jgi:hypothetical protein
MVRKHTFRILYVIKALMDFKNVDLLMQAFVFRSNASTMLNDSCIRTLHSTYPNTSS